MLTDLDNDGWLDLYMAGGSLLELGPAASQSNAVFHNRGDGTFEDVTEPSGGALAWGVGRTVVAGDVDGDGHSDLFVVNYDGAAALLRTQATSNHWLVVDLEGTVSNRDGIGARVEVRVRGLPTLVRDITSGSSLGGGNDVAAYFGLGKAAVVDAIEVRWPSGVTQRLADVPADQRLRIVEP